MLEHLAPVHGAVEPPPGRGKPTAGRGQGVEPEPLEQSGRSFVPRVGKEQGRGAVVQSEEPGGLSACDSHAASLREPGRDRSRPRSAGNPNGRVAPEMRHHGSMPVDGVEVRSALARQWGRIATVLPGLDLEAPSRIDGWRNREVVAHLTLQPVLLARFLETASDRSPMVTLPSNLTGTGGLAQVVDSSARDTAARGRIEFGAALDHVLPSLQAADLAATIEAVQGPILLVDYLVTRCVEAVVHGCDLVDPVVPDRIAEAVAADALLSVLVARAPELEADARALPVPRWIDMATGRSRCSGPLAPVIPVMTSRRATAVTAGRESADDANMVTMSSTTDDLARLWEWTAEQQFHGLLAAVRAHRPGRRRRPRDAGPGVVASHPTRTFLWPCFGAVHYLLLDGLDHPLAEVYAGRSDADPAPSVHRGVPDPLGRDRGGAGHPPRPDQRLWPQRADRSRADLARRPPSPAPGPGRRGCQRRPLPPVRPLPARLRRSRGDRAGRTRRSRSGAAWSAATRRSPSDCPPSVSRIGIDRSPLDLSAPEDARWLLACFWPDTGRLERTAASIRLAQADLPQLVSGDANEVLPGVLADLPDGTPAVVHDDMGLRLLLARAATSVRRDPRPMRPGIARWPGSAPRPPGWSRRSPAPTCPSHDGTGADLLGAILFDGGARTEQLLGLHPGPRQLDRLAGPRALTPHSGAWQTASTLLPSGSRTKAP